MTSSDDISDRALVLAQIRKMHAENVKRLQRGARESDDRKGSYPMRAVWRWYHGAFSAYGLQRPLNSAREPIRSSVHLRS